MIIHTENLEQVNQVCSFFSIPINTAEVEISFPYALELKTINGDEMPDTQFSFEEFKGRFLWKTL